MDYYDQGLADEWLAMYFDSLAADLDVPVDEEFPTTTDRLYGITYNLAEEAGWGDAWQQVMEGLAYSSEDPQKEDSVSDSGPLTESKLRSINDIEVSLIVTDWKNANGIITALPGGYAKVRYSGSTATFTTPINYWIGGGSPAGTVTATIIIDIYDGTIIYSSVQG